MGLWAATLDLVVKTIFKVYVVITQENEILDLVNYLVRSTWCVTTLLLGVWLCLFMLNLNFKCQELNEANMECELVRSTW